jgi:hypothetical protein
MSESQNKPSWVLSSPFAPSSAHDESLSQNWVRTENAEAATSPWHNEGYFLPGAEFEGWRFGLLQDCLHVSGLMAFVRSPLGVEATLVSDPHAQGIERVSVPVEPPTYAGAFRVQFPQPLTAFENVVVGFKSALPLIKQKFLEGGFPVQTAVPNPSFKRTPDGAA